MEQLEVSPSNVSPEIIPLSEARFLDRFETEYEMIWHDLARAATQDDAAISEVMIPIWKDPAYPQAFRDRALLYVYATYDIATGLGPEAKHWGTRYSDTSNVFRGSEFADWYAAACTYEDGHDEKLFGSQLRLNWCYTLYNAGLLSTEKLEDSLDKINYTRLSPVRVRDPSDDNVHVPLTRVPFIYDALHPDLAGHEDTPYRQWAIQKFTDWLSFQEGKSTVLPSWLSEKSYAMSELVKEMFRQKQCNNETGLTWNMIERAIPHVGWSAIYNVQRDGLAVATAHRIDDPSFRAAFSYHALTASKEYFTQEKHIWPFSLPDLQQIRIWTHELYPELEEQICELEAVTAQRHAADLKRSEVRVQALENERTQRDTIVAARKLKAAQNLAAAIERARAINTV